MKCTIKSQHLFGKPSRRGYHNKECADAMEASGLMPSSTGQFGGRRTGQHMDHYIVEGGTVKYVDLVDEGKRAKKAKSKTRFSCPACGQNAWGKPDLEIDCRPCGVAMLEVVPAEQAA